MAVFTAAATYLVTSFLGATFAATIAGTIVTSVVAAGIATVASRLINGGGGGGSGGTQQDPGVRIQLPPATDNKVPVIYGTVNTKSICVDARISDDNQQMTYVLILGEQTQTGTFTLGEVYWNDERLVFDTGANNYKVVSSIDQNGLGSTSTNLGGLIEMRVYAGSAQNSANQIFPSTNKVSAASYVGETTSTYQLNDLVYAVVKLTYSGEKGVTNLQQMTFEVQNSLSNPGLVLYDYLTSSRYGAGIDAAQIDTLSMTSTVTNTSLYSIANEIPPNQFNSNGSTSTQARYVINGVMSTGETVKNNLEKITQACASWLTYDFGQGKWSVIVNRALGAGELASVVTYNDNSIIGEVSVNATNLEDLYNAIEVEFPSREIRDQNDYYRAEIAQVDRNDLEPDNKLSLRFDLINNSIHAQRLGLIELNQSRVDRTIQFRTDYSGLQTQAGDVIKIVNEVYGFEDTPAKLFRVTRVREVENDDGGLFAEITGLEYDADVYGDSSITDYQPNIPSGIPIFGGPTSLPPPGVVSISQVFTSTNQPYFTIDSTIDATSGPIDRVYWYYSTSPSGTNLVYITDEVGPFYAGQIVTDSIAGLPQGTYYLYAKALKDGAVSNASPDGTANLPPIVPPYTAYTNGINWNPTPGGVNNGTISTSTFSSQIQIVNTSSGTLKIPLVATTSGYQPIYADTDLSYDASTNYLTLGSGINFATTGSRIIADMSSNEDPNPASARLAFQTNVTGGQTSVQAIPNGTGTTAGFVAVNNSGVDNAAFASYRVSGGEAQILAGRFGSTAPHLSIGFYTNGVTNRRMSISSGTGVVSILGTTDSFSTSTGILTVLGGAGFARGITVGTTATILGVTDSFSTTQGALKVSGGVGIARALTVGTTATIVGTTDSFSLTQGALIVSGGAGISKALTIGTTATIVGTTQATTTQTGALIVQGGVGIGGNAYIGGIINYRKTFGEFLNTATITPAAANTAYIVPVDTVTTSSNVTLSNTGTVTLNQAGVYNIQFSLQLANTDTSSEQDFDIWFRKNGTDLPNSNTQFSVIKQHSGVTGKTVAVLNFLESFAANDNFELVYAVSSTAVTIAAIPAQGSPYVRPLTPSVILTVVPVGA